MNSPVCKNLHETLVRHQFYTKIDWEMWDATKSCGSMSEEKCESECRAVIQRLIAGDASELPESAKIELEESLIRDIRVLGPANLKSYSDALNPPMASWVRVLSWLAFPVLTLVQQSNRMRELKRLRSTS